MKYAREFISSRISRTTSQNHLKCPISNKLNTFSHLWNIIRIPSLLRTFPFSCITKHYQVAPILDQLARSASLDVQRSAVHDFMRFGLMQTQIHSLCTLSVAAPWWLIHIGTLDMMTPTSMNHKPAVVRYPQLDRDNWIILIGIVLVGVSNIYRRYRWVGWLRLRIAVRQYIDRARGMRAASGVIDCSTSIKKQVG